MKEFLIIEENDMSIANVLKKNRSCFMVASQDENPRSYELNHANKSRFTCNRMIY